MSCPACKGILESGLTTFTVERGAMVLVVRRVPALVCAECGEELIAAETHLQLERIADHAETEGVQVAVRDYAETATAA